ncbi:MAG: UDP-N-acetylglucosamine 4,6-dehydratase (inverting), partial [Caulobacteraceae bacterium]|nr:UDP-N-acetylglucosamine 4,6-dehydratase (inverting) [Caulobacteraceae bacterium]
EKLHEMMISADDARSTVDLGDRYAIEPAFVEYARSAFAADHPSVAEDFSYASDTNDEWLTGQALLDLVAEKTPGRRRRATD